jgi:hypothetical protein
MQETPASDWRVVYQRGQQGRVEENAEFTVLALRNTTVFPFLRFDFSGMWKDYFEVSMPFNAYGSFYTDAIS